jgi:hypothetical protein
MDDVMVTDAPATLQATSADSLPDVPQSVRDQHLNSLIIGPEHPGDPDWPWITRIGPMRSHSFNSIFIQNTYTTVPKLTKPYRWWQYRKARQMMRHAQLAFLFSTDVGYAMTRGAAAGVNTPPRMYVGFTQDGPWEADHIARVADSLQRCDAVTVFTEQERSIYIDRYGVAADRMHVVPIHTDETDDYAQYPDQPPRSQPYALALGSPNRLFTPTARICRQLGVDLVIITRPWHQNDSLDELRELGAEIITDANKLKALTYLKHARLALMPFKDGHIAGGYTTLIHAMFLRTAFVAENCLGVEEHVIDGETGFVTMHGDYDALAMAIERLWNDPDLAQQYGEAAYQRARQRHSLDAAAHHFHELMLHVFHRAQTERG